MNVAFLGLGTMGLSMALNLQKDGFQVAGWNRTPGRGEALAAAGGSLAGTPAEAVAGADVIVTMLGGPASVAAVAAEFLPACRSGALWLESSTIGPAAARELAELAARHGVEFVDAPVTGSDPQAREGKLVFLVGGSENAVTRASPLLSAMGRQICHFGPVGQGAAAKLVNNMLVGTIVTALGEALTLAEQMNLDPNQMLDFLADGAAGAPCVKGKGALMKAREYPPSFQLKWMEKDLGLALAEAYSRGIGFPATSGAHATLAAARAGGFAEADMAAVHAYIRQMAAGRPDFQPGGQR